MTLSEINALSDEAFIAAFSHLYEHSPWVVEAATSLRPFADMEDMLAQMKSVLEAASQDQKRALLRAHPELAGKAAIDGKLTEASQEEQASAGLDRMHADEFEELTTLNAAYQEKFGFPFIICVRLTNKAGILQALRMRVNNEPSTEFETAIGEVGKIVKLRLEGMLS